MTAKLPINLKLNASDVLTDGSLDSIMDDVVNYLSERYGFCVKDYELNLSIDVSNINWDTSE